MKFATASYTYNTHQGGETKPISEFNGEASQK